MSQRIGRGLRARHVAGHDHRGVSGRVDHRGKCLSEIAALMSVADGGVVPAQIGDGRSGGPSTFPQSRAARATVLVIDDDPSVTLTFAHMLTLEGFDVRTAPDAE